MTLNKQLLLDEIEWVEKQDKIAQELGYSEWLQNWWVVGPEGHARWRELDESGAGFCGTAYCLAGHIAHTDHPEWDNYIIEQYAYQHSKHRLGLTEDEAHRLFYANNTALKMRQTAEQIIAAHEGEAAS